MPQANIDDLEHKLANVETIFMKERQKENEQIDVLSVVQLLFRLALEYGKISGKCDKAGRAYFYIGNDAPRAYTIGSAFRTLLAAIANFARLQSPSLPGTKKFNFYGDNQAVSCEIDGLIEHFQVETSNDNRKHPFYFTIDKL